MSRMLCRAIKAAGLSVDAFGSAEEFLDSEASRASVCLILDMNLPGMSGLELQQRLNASRLEVPIIFMSAQADEATQLPRSQSGAVGFFAQAIQHRIITGNPAFDFSSVCPLLALHQSTGSPKPTYNFRAFNNLVLSFLSGETKQKERGKDHDDTETTFALIIRGHHAWCLPLCRC